jgi:cytochrome c2
MSRAAWILLATGLLLSACSAPANQAPRTPGSADAARGRELFTQRGCGTCHTLQAAGSNATVGPNLNGIGTQAGERKPGQSAEAYLKESIENPSAFVVPNYSPAMPLGLANGQDLDDIVAFLLTQR